MAGNKNSGRRAGGTDFSPRVRSIVDQVLEKMEKAGDARALLEAQFREDFAGTLRAVASYVPKQIDMKVINEDAPSIIDTIDWAMLREAKKHIESEPDATTH